jgi:hypothetical protein
LIGLLLIGACLYFPHFADDTNQQMTRFECISVIMDALLFSFGNIFSFLGIHRLYFEADTFAEMATWQKCVAGLQALAGVFFGERQPP